MGRSPRSDESGLKKGPWTPEEDLKLVNYIEKNGHGSWRALPKLAGTLLAIAIYRSITPYQKTHHFSSLWSLLLSLRLLSIMVLLIICTYFLSQVLTGVVKAVD